MRIGWRRSAATGRSFDRAGIRLITAVAVVLGLPMAAPAQVSHGQGVRISQGLTYLSWDVSGDEDFTVAQWFVPVIIQAPLRDNLELAIYSGGIMSDRNDLTQGDISGLVDSRLQLSASFMENQILISGGASLPSGQTELSAGQQELIRWLASDFFNFPLKNTGEGLNVFGQLGFATPVGAWVFGAGGAVHVSGEYRPHENGVDYKPGTRLIATAGIERRWEKRHHLAVDLILTSRGDEKANDSVIFRDGTQIDGRLQFRLGIGEGSLRGAVRYVSRGKDSRLDPASTALIREVQNRNGNDLRIRFGPHVPLSPKVTAWAQVNAKFLSANDYPRDENAEGHKLFEDAARIIGVGGGVDIRLSPKSVLGLGFRIWSGSSDGSADYEKLDLSGFEIIQRLTITP